MRRELTWSSHADLAIKKTPTVSREDYLDHMTFRRNAGPMFTEIFGPLVGLKEEWLEQGATPEELDFSAFRYRCEDRARVAVATGRIGGHKPVFLEETDDYVLTRDGLGRTMKMMKGVSTLPIPMDHPVKTMDDWLALKPMYQFSAARFGKDWEVRARRDVADGKVLCVSIPGGFDAVRELMGEEGLCLAYYDQPELVHDVLETIGGTAVRVLDRVSAAVPVDLLSVHEDMAGKSGCLVGPSQIETFIKPYYRSVWDLVHERGARLFDLDTDGNINSVLPALIAAGVNLIHPMEPAAGMDIVKVRATYGAQLAFYGGIDKHILRRDQEAITAELEYKIPPMIASGGCVLGLDHRIPNGTPLENYRFYIRKAWEIMNRPLP